MIHTIIVAVLVYAALRAVLKRKPAAYKMQLVHRPEGLRLAARESGSTNLPNPFTDAVARLTTVEEPPQAKRARLELQRKTVARNALMMYYPSHLKLET